MNYQKIADRCQAYINHGCANRIGGRKATDIEIDRILEFVEKTCPVRLGRKQSAYHNDGFVRYITIRTPRCDFDLHSLYTLGHEHTHAAQDQTLIGGLTERQLSDVSSCGAIKISWKIVLEEAAAVLGGWKLALDLDVFHPIMIPGALRSWSTYLAGYIGQKALRRKKQQEAKL